MCLLKRIKLMRSYLLCPDAGFQGIERHPHTSPLQNSASLSLQTLICPKFYAQGFIFVGLCQIETLYTISFLNNILSSRRKQKVH